MSTSPRPVRGWVREFVENRASDVDAVFASINISSLEYDSFRQSVDAANVSGTAGLDLSSSNLFERTLTGNTTFEFNNAASNPAGNSFTLVVQQDGTGGHSITWPNSVEWDSGSAPSLSNNANDKHLLSFVTPDGGSTWYGIVGPTGVA